MEDIWRREYTYLWFEIVVWLGGVKLELLRKFHVSAELKDIWEALREMDDVSGSLREFYGRNGCNRSACVLWLVGGRWDSRAGMCLGISRGGNLGDEEGDSMNYVMRGGTLGIEVWSIPDSGGGEESGRGRDMV